MAEDVLFEFLHMEIVNLMYDSSAANDEQVTSAWQRCNVALTSSWRASVSDSRGGFTLGVRAFEAWLYTFMSHKSH